MIRDQPLRSGGAVAWDEALVVDDGDVPIVVARPTEAEGPGRSTPELWSIAEVLWITC